MKRILTQLAIVLTVITLMGCGPSSLPGHAHGIFWQGLNDGQSVYGIVKLAVKVSGKEATEVRFYLNGLGNDHLIGLAAREGDSIYTCDWHTQDATNGDKTLYALGSFDDNNVSQSSITIKVENRSRLDSIPATAIKMTPDNDATPPQLAPAFKKYWYDPMPVDGAINTAGAEDSPFVTPDGNTLYFWFTGDAGKSVYEQAKDPMTGIYWCKKVNGKWQEPQRLFLQYFNKIGFDGAETVRGKSLWFVSIREGNYRDMDFWTAELVNGKWTRWTNAGELLNKVYQIGELHITADGNEIYFDSTRPGGKGGKDIWVTRRVNAQWQEPQNIQAVNTSTDDGWPFISEDGTELWFTRLTPGPTIYRSLKVDSVWQAPELVVSHLAGEPTLDQVGNLYFVHHRWDDKLNRVTEADIYVCLRKL